MTSAWDFAMAAWRRPGLEAACLELQETHGQCVALLLWRLWAASEGREVDAAALDAALSLAREWEGRVLAPLRAVRKALREPMAGIDPTVLETLRRQILQAELDGERGLLVALEHLTSQRGGPVAVSVARHAIFTLTERWGRLPPDGTLDAVLAAL